MTTADSNSGFGIAQVDTPQLADSQRAPVVLEGRNLKKSYGHGLKLLPVLHRERIEDSPGDLCPSQRW